MQEIILPELLQPYSRFIHQTGHADADVKKQQFEVLDEFIRGHNKSIDHVKKRQIKNTYPDPMSCKESAYMVLTVLNHFQKEADDFMHKFEVQSLKKMVVIATCLKTFMEIQDIFEVDVDEILDSLNNEARSNPKYQIIRRHKRSLYKKAKLIVRKKALPDLVSCVKTEFINVNNKYIAEYQYCPPSILDRVIAEYIIHSPLKDIVFATAKMIAEGHTDSAVYTISEFCLKVYDLLNIGGSQSRSIIYCSVIRFLFNESYIIDSELRHYNKANALFLKRCEDYSKQTVRELRLTSDISMYYTPGLPVASLFKSKQVELLGKMETMTNPIDLMQHVHTIITSIAQYFGSEGGMLSFDDAFTLLLALTSLNPPANAVSIAKFVEKWKNVQLSDIIGMAKNYFIAAVETLLTEEELEMYD